VAMDRLVVVFGLGVGVLIGLTGIGGGSVMTPVMILIAGVQPVVAIGNRPCLRRDRQDPRRVAAGLHVNMAVRFVRRR